MRKFDMFITVVCVLFLVKLRWPKNRSLYDTFSFNFRQRREAFINTDTGHTLPLAEPLYRNEPVGKLKLPLVSGRFELSRIRVTYGKIAVNVMIDSEPGLKAKPSIIFAVCSNKI